MVAPARVGKRMVGSPARLYPSSATMPGVPRATAPQPQPTSNARSYQQLLTKLLKHGAYPQLRKVIDKTMPADLAPALPLLIPEDRNRVLSLMIEAGKAARALLELDADDLRELLQHLDDASIAAICNSSAPDDAADLLDELDDERRQRVLQ